MISRLAAALTLMAIASTTASSAEIVGAWVTSQGPMQIEQRADGNYQLSFDAIPGLVIGTLEGDRLVGAWSRTDGPRPCPTAKDGSLHWGQFGMEFRDDRFGALWTYCDDKPHDINFTGARAP